MAGIMPIERISLLCFGASYAVALLLELLNQLRPAKVKRLLATAFGTAGLVAHTLFLAVQQPPLSSQFGTLVFLAWVLAVFYLYGSLHYWRLAWAIFVLPLVLGLVILAAAFDRPASDFWQGRPFLGAIHGLLLLLGAVGVCVAFVASVMYLVQVHRLKAKTLPGEGLRLFSLERLEKMNRLGIVLAFPLLTAGILIGGALLIHDSETLEGWTDPKVLSSLILWCVFAILLYLRYGLHFQGRRVALLTIMAFALLLFTLVAPTHNFLSGGGP